MASNKTQLKANWEEMRGRVREAWGALTDDEVDRSQGQWDQLVASIRRKTGDTMESIEKTLNDMLDKLGDAGKGSK